MSFNFKPRKNIYYVVVIKKEGGTYVKYFNTTAEVAAGLSIFLGLRGLITPAIVRNILNQPQVKHERWKDIQIIKKDKRNDLSN